MREFIIERIFQYLSADLFSVMGKEENREESLDSTRAVNSMLDSIGMDEELK